MARKVGGEDRVERSRARVERLRNKAAAKPRPQPVRKPAKADAPPELTEPPCAECGLSSSIVAGSVIYPHRRDLAGLNFWKCPRCTPAAYVGCHKGGDGRQALGRPAGPYLRKARGQLHELIDPLWQNAERMVCYDQPFEGNPWRVRSKARVRVYAYLRVQMQLKAHEAHVAWLDLEQCRTAWRVLSNLHGEAIRDWFQNLTADEEAFLAQD